MSLIMEDKAVATDVPPEVWRHPLFAGCAEYVPVTQDLAIALCDAGLRRVRRMPSTADYSRLALLDAVQAQQRKALQWLDGIQDPSAIALKGLLNHLERLTGTQSNGLSDEMYQRAVTRLAESLPAQARAVLPEFPAAREDIRATLGLIRILIVDRFFRESAAWRNRYLKSAYRYADRALRYNTTTDLARMRPVLAWIRQVLTGQSRSRASYADVGCAVAEGAPAVVLAAETLRRGGLVETVHGTDIVVASRELVAHMRGEYHINLYSSNPVCRPLPMRYDVILLANVHRHLVQADQETLLRHLAASLNTQGLLFINWRFNDRESPCLCLQKNAGHIEVLAEYNCVF